MAKNSKEVKVKVATEKDLEGVKAIEQKIKELKAQKLHLDVEAKTEALNKVEDRINTIKGMLSGEFGEIHLDDSEVEELKSELASLEHKKAYLNIDVENAELLAAKAEEEALNTTAHVDIDVNDAAAQQAIDNIASGFDRLKQGASEVGEQMSSILESAGKQETNKAFLELAVGADQAEQKLNDINQVVQKLPGDDTVLQGLLSQAVAKDASLTTDELQKMGGAAADYFAGMENFGKSSAEAFQDMNNYLLTGQTAEIERSPLLANHIDKLKEANTIQERSALLQQALNEEHWGGISQQDTYNNKLQTFNGMLERGQYNLGGMFQEGAKGAMDFALKLDDATNGWVGMGLAALGFAQPLTDTVMGLGQMATGISAIKNLGFIKWLKEFELAQKLSTAATKIQTAWNWLLNSSFLANPIVLVVIALIALAAALIWAYQNVDWFREMVDNAWASIQQFATGLWTTLTSAVQWVAGLFQSFTDQLGLNSDDWIQSVLAFILFIPTLPLRLGVALFDALAKAMGFGDNFSQTMINGAMNAVNGFVSWITSLPGKLKGELDKMLDMAGQFALEIANKLSGGAAGMVVGWVTGSGEHSPGFMYKALEGELSEMEKLTSNAKFDMAGAGKSMSNSFNPNLGIPNNASAIQGYGDININIEGNVDSEERIQQIVDVIRRELSWDNQRAGRSV